MQRQLFNMIHIYIVLHLKPALWGQPKCWCVLGWNWIWQPCSSLTLFRVTVGRRLTQHLRGTNVCIIVWLKNIVKRKQVMTRWLQYILHKMYQENNASNGKICWSWPPSLRKCIWTLDCPIWVGSESLPCVKQQFFSLTERYAHVPMTE